MVCSVSRLEISKKQANSSFAGIARDGSIERVTAILLISPDAPGGAAYGAVHRRRDRDTEEVVLRRHFHTPNARRTATI
jgi:hypothetical protein